MKNRPDTLETLSRDQLIDVLLQQNSRIDSLEKTLENKVAFYEAQLRLLAAQKYGARSERQTNDLQSDLFNEAEVLVDKADEQLKSSETETITYERQKKRGRVAIDPALPRTDIIHDIPEADKTCACGCQKNQIGDERSERLDYVPPQLTVERHIRYKYACPACEEGVQIADRPASLLPKSNAAPGLLAYVVTAKYQDSLPLYRQSKILARHGVTVPSNTLANWMIKVSEAVAPVIDLMAQQIKQVPVILMDETTLQVNKEPDKKASSKSYMWIRRGLSPPDPDHPHGKDMTLFHYSPSRKAQVAVDLLSGYQGALMTDGYDGYNAAIKEHRLQHANCWAHARRKFIEAEKSLPKGKKSPAITAILNEIGKLYGIEKTIKPMLADDKQTERQAKAKPILEKLKTNLNNKLQTVTPKSKLGEAIAYTLKYWEGLITYLENGYIPIDNNGAENGIRPFVIGRKNWLFSDTVKGAEASARLYSIIETAKANGHEPYHYLRLLFTQLPEAKTEQDMINLLPWNVKRDY